MPCEPFVSLYFSPFPRAEVELTTEELNEIGALAEKLGIGGERYPEAIEKMIDK